jgi:hypothetical protein
MYSKCEVRVLGAKSDIPLLLHRNDEWLEPETHRFHKITRNPLSGSRGIFFSMTQLITHRSMTRVVGTNETGDISMSSKKKIAAIVITTVALTASTVGIASAASKSSSTRVSISNPGALGNKGPRGIDLNATLAALVAKGTITQAQADAIVAATNAARVAAEAARPAKPMKADHDARLALIATTIGIDSATIKSRLAAGETLGAIAGAKKDALIAALVADETKRIDAAVTAGKLTSAQATTLKSGLVAHVTDEVNQVRPVGPKGQMDNRKEKHGKGEKGGFGGRGHGPMGAAPKIPAPTASTSASA